MAEFRETFAEIGQGAWDVAGGAKTDIQNTYWNQVFAGGRPPSPTALTGDMEITTGTSEPLREPESMRSAILKHAAAEGAEREADHWRSYAQTEATAATQDNTSFYGVGAPTNEAAPAADASTASSGIGAPEGWEAFHQGAHSTTEVESSPTSGIGAPESWQSFNESAHAEPGGQGFYGVGPPAQDTQPTQDTAQPEQDSYGPEP